MKKIEKLISQKLPSANEVYTLLGVKINEIIDYLDAHNQTVGEKVDEGCHLLGGSCEKCTTPQNSGSGGADVEEIYSNGNIVPDLVPLKQPPIHTFEEEIPQNSEWSWEKEFEYSFGLDHPIQVFHDHDDFLMVKNFISKVRQQGVKEGYEMYKEKEKYKVEAIRTQTLTEVIRKIDKIMPKVYYRRIVNNVEVEDIAVPLSDIKTMVEGMEVDK